MIEPSGVTLVAPLSSPKEISLSIATSFFAFSLMNFSPFSAASSTLVIPVSRPLFTTPRTVTELLINALAPLAKKLELTALLRSLSSSLILMPSFFIRFNLLLIAFFESKYPSEANPMEVNFAASLVSRCGDL